MEQQFKTDSEIYAVLEREIIDLTLRPGCSLSENPLCTRFGAPRSLIRVVLQRLQENGLVKIVPYKGTTVTRLNRDIVDELIYERIAVEARVLRDFAPHCTPEHRALILLGYIGGKMLIEGIKGEEAEEAAELSAGALFMQGVATSIDALSVGFTISEYGWFMALVCSLIVAIVTFFICEAGLAIGKKFGTKLSGKASVLGGVILIGIGLEIFISGMMG